MTTNNRAKEIQQRLNSVLALADLTPWTLAKGGRSVNLGDFGKLRMEAGNAPDEQAAIMAFIAHSLRDIEYLLQVGPDGWNGEAPK